MAQRENRNFVELVEHWHIVGTNSIKATNIRQRDEIYLMKFQPGSCRMFLSPFTWTEKQCV